MAELQAIIVFQCFTAAILSAILDCNPCFVNLLQVVLFHAI